MINPRFDDLGESPFERLNRLIDGIKPGQPPIVMSLGEPQHPYPNWVGEVLDDHRGDYGAYPPLRGSEEFLRAVADWLTARYALPVDFITWTHHIVPLSGTREGLYFAPQIIVPRRKAGQQPAVLIPNPFYHAYAGAAVAVGAEPVYLAATRDNGFMPDLDKLDIALLNRTAAFYICSPANPQGTVADRAYLDRLIDLARRHDFVVLSDECYSEIFAVDPPPGILEAAAATGSLANVFVFNSLSKRSSVPGLRSGFVAGDPDLIARLRTLRSYGGALPSIPVMAAAAALWRDETHVVENRARYARKFDTAERIIGNRFGFYRPAGGFFLWLEVGDGESATSTLWREAGLKVLPGGYVARDVAGESNPGAPYIRLALVHDDATTEEALTRLSSVLPS
ncbi:MAG: aminotransferase class I/II-fold pyridoxal phosphate-dependent enzyme [Proteobacteria bacterium]|nr:aminotransferase class I/II-fold pyridoxal phosphate-dependent enzyme [Pseudomonadota bacterium]MDA1057893.1 aminotransferase class I/II-fold pyridoxal phosphate-dependent enzyme [Pseudomonadota bacterium]